MPIDLETSCAPSKTFSGIARGLLIRLIEAEAGDPAEQKARVIIAFEHGHLSEQEAADWIAILGVQAA